MQDSQAVGLPDVDAQSYSPWELLLMHSTGFLLLVCSS